MFKHVLFFMYFPSPVGPSDPSAPPPPHLSASKRVSFPLLFVSPSFNMPLTYYVDSLLQLLSQQAEHSSAQTSYWVHKLTQRVDATSHCLQPPLSGYVFKYLRASDYHVGIALVVKNHSSSLFLFYFLLLSLLYFAPRGYSGNSITPTALNTNTRPSSKMPRHRINDSHIGLGPTLPTLSWRLNCDKTPLFLQRERESKGGTKEEKIRQKATSGNKGVERGEVQKGRERKRQLTLVFSKDGS